MVGVRVGAAHGAGDHAALEVRQADGVVLRAAGALNPPPGMWDSETTFSRLLA